MPTYDYLCPNGHRFEVIHSVTAAGPTTCPVCGEVLFVNTHYQRWTCLRRDRGFPDANDKLPTPSDWWSI